MSATRYKQLHVDILICIEMTRERHLGIKKPPGISIKYLEAITIINIETIAVSIRDSVSSFRNLSDQIVCRIFKKMKCVWAFE